MFIFSEGYKFTIRKSIKIKEEPITKWLQMTKS